MLIQTEQDAKYDEFIKIVFLREYHNPMSNNALLLVLRFNKKVALAMRHLYRENLSNNYETKKCCDNMQFIIN